METGLQHQIQAAIKAAFDDITLPDADSCAATREKLNTVEGKLQRHEKFIDGNGKDGAKVTIPLMQKDIKDLRYDVGILRSDVREILNKLRSVYKEGESLWEKILPGLVEKIIIAIVTVFIALTVTHWTEIFP